MRRHNYKKPTGAHLMMGLLGLSLNITAVHASPFEISYSARLVDESARPLTGTLKLSIRFFDAAIAGNQKSGELNFPKVQPNEAGIFTVSLAIPGTEFSAILGDDQGTWIEVTDVNTNRIYPRQKLSTVPYALRVPYDSHTLRYDSEGRLAVNQIEQSQVMGLADRLGQLTNSVHTHNLGGDLLGDLSTARVVKLGGRELSNSAPTAGQYLKWSGTAWTPASLSGELTLGTQATFGLGSYSNPEEGDLKITLRDADMGKMWFNTQTEQIKYWDGSAIKVVGAIGSELNNLNGQIGGAQSFAYSSAGTTPAWSSADDTHTFNIPMASAAGVTAGLISKSEFDSFSAKMNSNGGSFTGEVYFSGQNELRFSELSPMDGGNYLALRAPPSISNNFTLTLPDRPGAAGQVLSTDSSGTLSWIPSASGALTALSATIPLSASTGSMPTLSITQAGGVSDGYLSSADWNLFNAKQPADNYITALSGDGSLSAFSAGSATFKLKNTGTEGTYVKVTTDAQGRVSSGVSTIANADIAVAAAIDASKIAGGQVSSEEFNTLGSVTSDIQTQLNAKANATNPTFTGALSVPLGTAAAPSLSFTDNLGTGLWSPTADDIAISTNGTERLRILVNGNIGIGITDPGASLQVKGGTAIGYNTATAAPTNGLTVNGRVGIGTTSPNSAAQLELSSSSQGFLPPRMTTVQRLAISSPPAGLMVWDTTTNSLQVFTGSAWMELGGVVAGTIAYFDKTTCPAGWTEKTELRGRYAVGLPSGGTVGSTSAVGTALTNKENRPVGQHNHGVSDPGHAHGTSWFVTNPGSGGTEISGYGGSGVYAYRNGTSASGTGVSINNAGSVAGTNAPYLQLLACEKN